MRRINEIERCFNTTDRVWLTFDDGGSPSQVGRILGTLARMNVRGRFFFTGAWAARYPGLMRRIRAEGRLVANHSYAHVPLSKVSSAEVAPVARGGNILMHGAGRYTSIGLERVIDAVRSKRLVLDPLR